MSLRHISPLVMPSNLMESSMQSPMQQSASVSPQEWEYIQTMRRTGWDMNQQFPQQNQIPQSDPYIDFVNEFGKCSSNVQNRILEDSEFKMTMNECDKRMQSMIEDVIRPQVMQTSEGRIAFERMLATFRQVRDKYIKEESENLEALHQVMQDEVVKQRIAELNNKKKVGNVE